MCIAILNASGEISRETLKTCWQNNPDGAGFAFPYKKSVKVVKELSDFDKFADAYALWKKAVPDKKFMIHFRIATQGVKELHNCHPFVMKRDVAFMHNGMLKGLPYDTKYSDTYLLNSMIFKNLKKMPVKAFVDICKIFTGDVANKLVFLNAKNEHLIINAELGSWENGNWYSNGSYKPTRISNYTDYDYDYGYTYGKYQKGRSRYTGHLPTPIEKNENCIMCYSEYKTNIYEGVPVCLFCESVLKSNYKKVYYE